MTQSGTQVLSSGGFARFSSMSMRGASSKDVVFSLEGVRLNSPAQGTFDLGQISTFGLAGAHVVLGGYSPYSTSLGGQVHLKLSSEPVIESKIGWGSFNFFSFSQRVPGASLSFESSQNDFLFKNGTIYQKRIQNESLRANLRFWHQTENHQFFLHTSLIQRQLPPPASDLTAQFQKSFQSISPLVAYLGQRSSWSWSLWTQFENQDNELLEGSSQNQIWYSGANLKQKFFIGSKISGHYGLEWTQDHLFHADFQSKQRHTLSLSSAALWSPHAGQTIHPRVRFEMVTDLNSKLSAHPGLGGIHFLHPEFSMLWNVGYVSRSPNFSELYYSLGSFKPNPRLERENSIQGDAGWEWKSRRRIKLVQSLFLSRTSNTIVTTEALNGTYQSSNAGRSSVWGLENDAFFYASDFLELQASYTFSSSKLNGRPLPYFSKHIFFLSPDLRLSPLWRLSPAFFARSSARSAVFSNRMIPPQFDLRLRSSYQWMKWRFHLEIFNLLRRNLQRDPDYPDPSETHFKISMSYQF